jgi:hypothetical protein
MKNVCVQFILASLGFMVCAPCLAKPNTVNQPETRTVTTHRADGALFPQARQLARSQKPRRVSVSGSRQALPARGTWAVGTEPAGGGNIVAPAASLNEAYNAPSPVVVLQQLQTKNKAPRVK